MSLLGWAIDSDAAKIFRSAVRANELFTNNQQSMEEHTKCA